jgi:hypothetical protein
VVPHLVVAKEISREDVRLGLEKMADRFLEHPTTVLVVTNLHYADAPVLRPGHAEDATRQLAGARNSRAIPSHDTRGRSTGSARCSTTAGRLARTKPAATRSTCALGAGHLPGGSRLPADAVIPRPETPAIDYDFILASQPWRARMSAQSGGQQPLPLVQRLRRRAAWLVIQSRGDDPGVEIVRALWPGDRPSSRPPQTTGRVRSSLGAEAASTLPDPPDSGRSSATRCRCLPRSAIASARRCCSWRGTRLST